MSFSQRLIGKNLKVFWHYSGGTADLSGDRRSLDIQDTGETVDATGGNDDAKAYKGTLRELRASFSALYIGTAGTATYAKLKALQEGTLVWGANGTAAGNPKGGFPAIISAFNQSMPYNDNISITVEFMPQGDYTFDPNTATW